MFPEHRAGTDNMLYFNIEYYIYMTSDMLR